MPPTALRVLVTLLTALAVVAQIAYLDALSWHALGLVTPVSAPLSAPFLAVMSAHAAVSLIAGVLAVALVLNEGPWEAAARGLGVALAAWSYLTAYSGVTLLLSPEAGALRALFESHFLAVELLGLAGFIRFTALFPTALVKLPPASSATLPAWLVPLHATGAWMQRPFSPWIAALVVLTSLLGLNAARGVAIGDAGLSPLMDGVRFAAAGLVVLNLRTSWSHGRPEDHRRLAWLLLALAFMTGGLLLLVSGNVLVAVTGWPEPEVAWRPVLLDVGLAGFLTALSMSVLYRGTLQALRAARRIAATAAVWSFGLFLAAALEALLGGGALGGASLRTGVGTLLAFVLVVATHRNFVRSIDRALARVPGLVE